MFGDTLADWANIATIVGAIVAVAVLAYTAWQVRLSTFVSRAQFWLELENMFERHDEIHLNLRPGGQWWLENQGPMTAAEWAKVEDYMGLFEHCEIMMRKKLIDEETFRSIYSYRLKNLARNRSIVDKKLVEKRDSWQDFLRLLERFNISLPSALD